MCQSRFDSYSCNVLVFTALISSVIVIIPYKSQTLLYISMNGAVNIYLILIAFLCEPYVESDIQKYRDDDTICKDEDEVDTVRNHIEMESLES
jgi:hypothetical protein